MHPTSKFDDRYLATILIMSFASNVGQSYEEGLEEVSHSCPTPEHRENFAAALRRMILDPSMTLVEKCQHYVEEDFPTEDDARDFLTFIWESVTDKPWPSEIPKGNGKRFLPPPGHARGY